MGFKSCPAELRRRIIGVGKLWKKTTAHHRKPQKQQGDEEPGGLNHVALFKDFAKKKDLHNGSKLHAAICKNGLISNTNVFVGSSLLNMYANCGASVQVQEVFDELSERDVVLWTALIDAYAQLGHGEEALNWFERMQVEGVPPNAVTFLCTVKACSNLGALRKGEELHARVQKQSFLTEKPELGNALVGMYAKCGALIKAKRAFDELFMRTLVSWNVLISGYVQHGLPEEALKHYEGMQEGGLSPDAVTFVCILKACGSIGVADKGESIHAEILRQKLLGNNVVLGNALVDMYAKCGVVGKAQQVFNDLPVHDVVAWTALLAGYVQAGDHGKVFHLFNRMTEEGTRPNLVTFVVLLKSCSHSILMEGQSYFEVMSSVYGMIPTSKHHTCMVDLLGRAGYFDKALAIINKMPSGDYLPAWLALMGACRKWGDVDFGKLTFERVLCLDRRSAVAYTYMSDVYNASGMQEAAYQVEAMRICMDSQVGDMALVETCFTIKTTTHFAMKHS